MIRTSFTSRTLMSTTLALAAVALPTLSHAVTFSEGFDAGVPAGWSQQNNSSPAGLSTWTQGGTALSPAHSGASNSFVVVNFNSGTDASTLSNWLWTPTLTVNPDSVLTFYTRVGANPAEYPDRLEVRWSDAATANPGTAATDVGTFTALLLTVNPNLTPTGYPGEWTAFTYSFSGLVAPSTGNLGLRYFVTDGGPAGNNSDIIGLDTFSITNVGAVPEPGTYALMALGLAAVGLRRLRSTRA